MEKKKLRKRTYIPDCESLYSPTRLCQLSFGTRRRRQEITKKEEIKKIYTCGSRGCHRELEERREKGREGGRRGENIPGR